MGVRCIYFGIAIVLSFSVDLADALRHSLGSSAPMALAPKKNTFGDLLQNATHMPGGGLSFEGFYDTHFQGRGIWKWNNAVLAYQRHFSGWKGYPVKVGEVGVQSGGSIDMWTAAMGSNCFIYGFDINPACSHFADASTIIVIGDQADPAMWQKFFVEQTPNLDILVDDGGHEPHQMLTTLYEVWNHLSPGGFISIEDIHGQQYLNSFFIPAAQWLSQQGNLDSVHVYPFLLIAQRAGQSNVLPQSALVFPPAAVHVTSFEEMWQSIAKQPIGAVVLENPGWGSFMTQQGLTNFFTYFKDLHAYDWYDVPDGCAHTKAAVCTNIIRNSPMQDVISGIHIYNTRLVVEVAPKPMIQAVRRGTQWIDYR